MRTIAQTAVDNETYFCELDAVVGDGDFGYSLARGFEIVAERLGRRSTRTDVGDLPEEDRARRSPSASAAPPGRSGAPPSCAPAARWRATPSSTGDDVVATLRAAIEGIKQRGNSDLGDKTLLDALVPADRRARGRRSPEGAPDGARSARRRRRARAPRRPRAMLAKRGRASYTGERSIATRSTPGRSASRSCSRQVSKAWQEAELERA